jgi:PhnB protein
MSTVKKIPDGFHAITPYLSVKDAIAAIRFYQQVFGAKEIGRISMPDGSVGHAELRVGDSTIMLAEEMPVWGNKSPATLGGSPVGIALYVNDVDAVFRRALDAGATEIESVKDQFYGDRSGTLTDPFGHKWHILTHIEDVTFPEMQKRCDAMFAAQKQGK